MIRLAIVVLVGCGSVPSEPDAPPGGDGGGDGADVDATPARCNRSSDFGTPTLVGGVNSTFDEYGMSLTRDELIAFVGRYPPGDAALRMTTRASVDDDFGAVTEDLLGAINSVAGSEYSAAPTADGLILYFHRQNAMGIGVEVSTRGGTTTAFGASSGVTVDGPGLDDALTPFISSDGQTLYWLDFAVFRLHAATRGGTPSIFTNARDASTIDNVYNPVLSADELTLYSSNGMGDDVLAATRADRNTPFGAGTPVNNVNSASDDWPVYVTSDDCVMYLASNRTGGLGGTDIWMATRGN
jgi:hypothetical protein